MGPLSLEPAHSDARSPARRPDRPTEPTGRLDAQVESRAAEGIDRRIIITFVIALAQRWAQHARRHDRLLIVGPTQRATDCCGGAAAEGAGALVGPLIAGRAARLVATMGWRSCRHDCQRSSAQKDPLCRLGESQRARVAWLEIEFHSLLGIDFWARRGRKDLNLGPRETIVAASAAANEEASYQARPFARSSGRPGARSARSQSTLGARACCLSGG